MAVKAKSKKPKAPKSDMKAQFKGAVTKVTETFATHGVVIMFVLAGTMIGLALMRSRGYLNPVRDESRYTEASGRNNYSKIDYKLVSKLEETLNKAPVDVNPSLAPNRNNPFSE